MSAHEEHDDHDEEEGFRGTLTVTFTPPSEENTAKGDTADDVPAAVAVAGHIAGNFDPLSGEFRWVGRLSHSPEITAAATAGWTRVTLQTPEGHTGHATLREANLWGGYRVTGTGSPPFPVPEIVLDEDLLP